jgi:enamine deaminase RidA (YjgF/YER057c/UK114 family)
MTDFRENKTGDYGMEQRKVNPWEWQDQFAFSQAIEVVGGNRVLYCAGQTSVDEQGRPLHAGDMRGQVEMAFQNLETVLKTAGFTLTDVIRLNYYTTDVDKFFGAHDIVKDHLSRAGCQPAGTLLGVAKLAFPELLIEIEATAVK